MSANQSCNNLPDPDRLWLCEHCDRMIPKVPLDSREKALCPDCGFKVAQGSHFLPHLGLALSVTGLLLLIPAAFLPLLHMNLLLQITDHSILSGIRDFIQQGMWVPAVLIFLGTLISPFVYLALTILVLFCILRGINLPGLGISLRLLCKIRNWGMIEVYLLGVIIAIIKLGDIAKVYPGFGLATLAGVMICQSLVALLVRPDSLWERIETLRKPTQKA